MLLLSLLKDIIFLYVLEIKESFARFFYSYTT